MPDEVVETYDLILSFYQDGILDPVGGPLGAAVVRHSYTFNVPGLQMNGISWLFRQVQALAWKHNVKPEDITINFTPHYEVEEGAVEIEVLDV